VAFERAIELGAEMVELDVQLTRDRRLVVLHDLFLGRTVSGSGWVREHSLDDLRALDAGAWFGSAYAGAHVLSLDEVLDITAGHMRLNVEIKSPADDWQTLAEVLIGLLEDRNELAPTIISCFDVGALRCVRAVAASAQLGMLWHEPDLTRMWAFAHEVGARTVHPFWQLIDAELVATARRRGMGVIAWTVNDVGVMRQLAGWGVDGIISDFPERFDQLGET
jgi:glycerophosphoryl diester phosphodiesterase